MGKRLGWDGLNNSVLFTWGFVEMLLWFWVCFIRRPELLAPLNCESLVIASLLAALYRI